MTASRLQRFGRTFNTLLLGLLFARIGAADAPGAKPGRVGQTSTKARAVNRSWCDVFSMPGLPTSVRKRTGIAPSLLGHVSRCSLSLGNAHEGSVKANKYRRFSASIRPSAAVIREQKQWSSSPPWCASRQCRIYPDNARGTAMWRPSSRALAVRRSNPASANRSSCASGPRSIGPRRVATRLGSGRAGYIPL